MQKVIIIIPTYNESENIASVIESLQTVFVGITNCDLHILIYDSGSPDKTADIVRDYQKKYSNIILLTEEKKSGLGNAYSQAMRYAMDTLHADIVFEFDADGSHRPDYLPTMIHALTQDADVVVGSRYVAGGSIPKEWALHRKLLSILGNVASRIILSPKIKDYTSGFRGTRTTFLKKINLDKFKSKGYAYKIQLMWELFLLGARIKEIPIQFIDREKGYSKLPKNNALESLWLIIYLRFLRLERYFKVCCVGAVGVIVQLFFFNLLRRTLHPVYANMISTELAIIVNFYINHVYTFADKARAQFQSFAKTFKKLCTFNFVSLGSLSLQTLIVFLGGHFFGHAVLKDNLYVLIGIGLGSIVNYKIYQHVIWKN